MGRWESAVLNGAGLFTVDDVRNTLNLLKSREHAMRWLETHEGQVSPAERDFNRATRLCVVEGKLRAPVPPPASRGNGRLVPITADGRVGMEAVASIALGYEVIALAIHGDPPGTWRGSAFTPTRVVIELWPGDDRDLYADLAPVERITTERTGDPAHRLSSIVRRYAAGWPPDDEWWTA